MEFSDNLKIKGEINFSTYKNKGVNFFVSNPDDHIMAFHSKGEFYELEELEIIGSYLNGSPRILEVGANIGNHVIFYGKILNASKIVAFEPNPTAYNILKINCLINQLDNVDLSYLGFGLSNNFKRVQINERPMNLGGSRLEDNENGKLLVVEGDFFLKNSFFDFIKIDVEDFDLEVLLGLEKTISRSTPPIFIEVLDTRHDEFEVLLDKLNYKIDYKSKKYKLNTNYIIIPNK